MLIMRQRMLYLLAGAFLVLHSCGALSYGQGTSQQVCRDVLLRRETNLKEAKAVVQQKLNRMYERMNRMKMRTAELENGLTQIDDHLKKVSLAIVDLDK